MTFIQLNDKDFIGRLTEFILADLKDENFGVREFAAIQVTIPADNSQQVSGSKEKVKRNRILKLILISAMILAVAGTVAFTAYRIMDQNSAAGFQASHDDRLSVAVLPFRNMTNDSAWNIWQEGIQSCLINSLGNVNDIIVRSEETINDIIESAGVTNYASLELDLAIDVTQRLSSKVFLYGNINKAGPTIRLNAQLIEAENEEVFSSIHIDGSSERILEMIDSLSIAINNALIMFELEKIKPENIHDYKDNTTKSPDTYKYFIYGNLAYYKNDFPTAIELYLQALEKDSTFYKPMAKLATAYYNLYNFKQGKEWCGKYYAKKDLMNMKDRTAANALYALFFGTLYDRIKCLRLQLDLDDQNPMTWFNIGDSYFEMMQYDKAIPEYEKALELFHKFGTKPYWGAFYYELGISYHKTGQYRKEEKLYKRAEKDFPNDPGLMDQQAWLELTLGNNDGADYYLNKWISIRKEEGWTEARIAGYMAYIYSMSNMPDKEDQYYRKALSLEPDKAPRLNSLAYFLIDKERNIDEGMALVEKVLRSDPNNYNSMHIKGYALYKQGKYHQALDLMQLSWNLRMQQSIYNHRCYLQLEETRNAVNKL